MIIIYWGIGWSLGLWLASRWLAPWWGWLLLAALGLLGALLLRRAGRSPWLLVAVLGLGLGGVRYVTAVPTIDASHIAFYNDADNVTLTGLVVDEPDVHDRHVNLRVRAERLRLPDGSERPVSGLVLVSAERFPVIAYGTRLQVIGALETPRAEGEFNYRAYLARQGIHSSMPFPQTAVLATGQGSPLYHAIYAVKERAQQTIERQLPAPQSALLTGILLGDDNGLPPDLEEDFRTTGMTHIIAISGFNIAILIALLVGATSPFMSPRGSMLVAVIGIAFYTLLVGADASVVRAALMGSIYLFASRFLGRPNFALASLFLAGIAMTAVNPHTLWDVGFQLSFAATLGLMLYADPFTRWTRTRLLAWVERDLVERTMGVLSEAVLITLAAQVLTLPLMMGYFGQLSLVSLPANALILPAQPGVMIWGGLATLTGMLLPAVGQALAWVAWLFLSYTTTLVGVLARLPWAVVEVELSGTAVALLIALILAATWLAQRPVDDRPRWFRLPAQSLPQRVVLAAVAVAALLTGGWSLTQPDGRLHVVFFDVGRGDATFIQTPAGRQILIDGGNYPSRLRAHLGRHVPFWDRDLDLVVATHADADHVRGLADVFARYRVGRLITNGDELGVAPAFDAVLRAALDAETPVHQARVGEVIHLDSGVRLEVLHPGEWRSADNRNDNSVAMRLVYDEFTLLLTGDAEEAGEAVLLAGERPLQAIVFKAGHHGARGSSSLALLQAVQPQVVVVSSGADNRFGHPHAEVLQRAADVGATVLRTDQLGNIEVISNGQEMWWRAGP